MNHSYYQKWQSQEHTNVQIKDNIPFLYFAAFNRQCRRFIVNHRVRFFSDISRCQHWLFFNFSDVGPEWFLAKSCCACCTSWISDQHNKHSCGTELSKKHSFQGSFREEEFNICVTNDHGYAPLIVNTSQSFPHSWLIIAFLTR